MKKSELKAQIEELITEILSEAGLYTLKDTKKSALGLAQTLDPDDATENSPQFKTLYKKVAESDEEDDEFDALDDTTSDKESNKYAKEEEKKNKKANKKRDEIVSAYKKIAGDIKAKAKAANSGDKEAKAWILKHQDTIKAYNKLKN